MKRQLLLLIAFCFSLQVLQAQTVDFVFTLTSASSDSACDGEISVICNNPIAPFTYQCILSTDETIVGTTNTALGLCSDNDYHFQIYNSYCQLFDILTHVSNTPANTSYQMNLTLNYNNNSLQNISINEVIGGVPPYKITLADNNNNSPILIYSDTLINISNLFFDSLHNHTYIIEIGDSNFLNNNSPFFNYFKFYFNTFYDSTGNCDNLFNNNIWASAQGSPVSDSSACDGHAFTEVYGGTPPYTYQYSSGSTSDTANGLCPGSYIVTVTDANGDVFNTSFVIGYPNTYYYSGGSSNYLDTLYSNALQDCGIDYTLPIDSFYIDSAYALSNWEYVVSWTIVQDSNEFLFTETYFVDSTGYYYFGLSLYCDEAQRVSSNFASYTFFAGAYADMSSFPTQVENLTKDNSIAVYPNPNNGIFTITSSKKMTNYSIFDTLGRKVASKTSDSNTQSVDIQTLNTGIYYLMVQFEDGTTGKQKLMKK